MIRRSRGAIDSQRAARFLLAAVFAMNASCGSPPASLPLIDSGIGGNTNATIQWEGNDRVVFQGYDTESSQRPRPMNISIWTVGKGVSVYKQHVRYFCAKNSTIAYMLEGDDSTTFYGTRGAETPIVAKRLAPSTCQPKPENHDPEHHIDPLLPAHGFIDRGPLKGARINHALVLFKPGAAQGIELPLRDREINGISYVPFKNAYFIQSDYLDPATNIGRSPWPQSVTRPLWWMTPDGSVTAQHLGAPWNQSARFFPTAVGLVASGYDARVQRPRWPDDAGLFLLGPGGEVTKIIGGQITEVAVSPNGCLLAFFHVEQATRHDSAKLKVVNLCDRTLPK